MITYFFLFFSTLGFLDSTFLTIQHYSNDPFSCPLFGGCDLVTNSVYSEILGIPIALLGAFYYATIFILSLYSFLFNNKKGLILTSQLSLAGLLASLILIYLQVYVIQAICFYCMVSAFSSISIFAISMLYLKKTKNYFSKPIVTYLGKHTKRELFLGILRISMGFIFLWAFLEKAPGWFSGGFPARGFLLNGTKGVFADLFASGAENIVINFFYMFGLFSVGVALIFGITKKLATIGGVLMMLFIYLAALPPENNPLIDEHIIYILVLLVLYFEKK